MSLYALPVSVSDLSQLQLGLEFFTNTTDATTEAALISTPPNMTTVYSYATQLLSNNISLSQVAMAVDSLMFGITDNTNELTSLSKQFLPAQVANALANGFNPTVYAAETLGLALAGGNGTSNAFATTFGSLSAQQFASEVASLTGINSGAIQGFVQNWINFYTANPSATFNLSVTLAAYGAAFGDTVGAALLNPTVNGDLALLVSEEQNALIDNAEGLYTVGIPLAAEPPHISLQGEAFLIPNAGGAPLGPTIDWGAQLGAGNYAQFVDPAQTANLTIKNTPGTFTLNTQHFATTAVEIDAAGNNGKLCTLVLGDNSAGEVLGPVHVNGYATVDIVVPNAPQLSKASLFDVAAPTGSNAQLLISGSGFLTLGDTLGQPGDVSVSVSGGTITDVGVGLGLGVTDAETIDASNAPFLRMSEPASPAAGSGITVLGGTAEGNFLEGSLGGILSSVTFTDSTTTGLSGLSATFVGADKITSGVGGDDIIYGDGGADTIALAPNHSGFDRVFFGSDGSSVLAITDGSDQAYPGFWGASAPTSIPTLFSGPTGGTSADMTSISGFHVGSGGDQLIFDTVAWNGASAAIFGIPSASGDLVHLSGAVVASGDATQLSAVWANSGSNSSLKSSDDVLLYAPGGGSPHNAQELAAQLHGASGAVVLPGSILPGQDQHILVAYDANSQSTPIAQNASAAAGFINPLHGPPPVVHIADVDLVNTSGTPQSSTFNLNVYASDMVSLTGVSLTSLTADNIHFF